MTKDKILQGFVVSRRFNCSYVILSYIISYIGSWTTLELIGRRTSIYGLSNWVTLGAASFSMGGIATWCMHYIGNQAIILETGKTSIQIKYDLGFTLLSFCLPIFMSFMAFVTVGSDEKSTSRVILGGMLNSFGILGMHYLAQAGISNYQCVYQVYWILGAVILSFSACVTGLSQFFLYRLSWESSWWKRAACAFMISAGISAIHWLSSLGTIYQLQDTSIKPRDKYFQIFTIIVISLLSIIGCLVLFLLGIMSQRRRNKTVKRSQQLVLAIAKFDKDNKLLVTPSGALPLRKITNSWLERSLNDEFNISHPIFLWMFGTSRNWKKIVDVIPRMRSYVKELETRRFNGFKNPLMSDEGIPIKDYSLVFEVLFCITASDLANDLSQPLEKIGILFDEIVNTEQIPKGKSRIGTIEANTSSSIVDLENDAMVLRVSGKGQIIFLVSRAKKDEVQQLQAAGYRFAVVERVAPILAANLCVKGKTLTYYIKMMQNYISDDYLLEQGLYFSIFAMRASLISNQGGFGILTRRDAKAQLPSMKVDISNIKAWHIDYVKALSNKKMSECLESLSKAAGSENNSRREQKFAQSLLSSLQALKHEMVDPIFDEARTFTKPLQIPCRVKENKIDEDKAIHIVFRILLSIERNPPVSKLVFVPLDFFKAAQYLNENSRNHAVSSKVSPSCCDSVMKSEWHSFRKNSKTDSLDFSECALDDQRISETMSQNINASLNEIPLHPVISSQLPETKDFKEMSGFVDELVEATIVMRNFQSGLPDTKTDYLKVSTDNDSKRATTEVS